MVVDFRYNRGKGRMVVDLPTMCEVKQSLAKARKLFKLMKNNLSEEDIEGIQKWLDANQKRYAEEFRKIK